MGDATIYGYGGGGEGKYRKDGNISSITEQPRNGSAEKAAGLTRVTAATYGVANQIVLLSDPDGGSKSIVRDTRGNPSSIVTSAGAGTTTYDDFGRLSTSTTPKSGLTTYGYYTGGKSGYLNTAQNAVGSTTYGADTRGNVTSIQDADGHSQSYTINKLDQLETEQKGQSSVTTSFDAAGNPATRNAVAGFQSGGTPVYSTTSFTFDELARLRIRSENGATATYGFDTAGNLSSVTRTATTGVLYGYDSRDRQNSVTTSAGTTTAVYDDADARVSDIDALGQTTTYSSDGFARRLAATEPGAASHISRTNSNGKPVETKAIKTLSNGARKLLRWTQQQYDPAGRLIREVKKIFPEPLDIPADDDVKTGFVDAVTTTEYDDAHHRVITTDPLGHKTVVEYDEVGRERLRTDALGNSAATTYTAAGFKLEQAVTEKRPDGSSVTYRTRYEYDDNGRVITMTDLSDPSAPAVTRYAYDVRGNMTGEVSPEGQITSYEYDLRGHRTTVTDPQGGLTAYRYDDAGHITAITDSNHNTTSFAYDDRGNLLTETRADGAKWTYSYDANDNRLTATDPNGSVTTYTFDAAQRLVGSRTDRAVNVLGANTLTITRDDLGRAVRFATDDGVITTSMFDSLDRELKASLQLPGSPERSVVREFDLTGNMTSLTTPSGAPYGYEYDGINRIARINDAAGVNLATYTDSGTRLLTRSAANGVTDTRSYDFRGRLIGISDQRGCSPAPCSPTSLLDIAYRRSPTGRKTDDIRGRTATRFSYDANSWLTRVDSGISLDDPLATPAATTSYQWDALLNLESVSHFAPNTGRATATFEHNARNQYTLSGGQTLEYDRNGNLTSYRGLALQYDAQNQVRRAVSGPSTVTATYDALGRKVEEATAVGTATTKRQYVYDGGRVVEEYVDGSLSTRFVNGRGADEIVRVETPNTSGGFDYAFPIQDELGTVNAVADGQGNVVERYSYDAFGIPTRLSVAGEALPLRMSWRWLFQGREYQPILAAYDFRSRTLWPDLARFGQEDPAGFEDSTNLYQAFGGRPTDVTDPTGRLIHEDEIRSSTLWTKYDGWRNEFLGAPLGHTLWDRLDATFYLWMKYDHNIGDAGAVTERTYDSTGAYKWADIRFSEKFGTNVANDASLYRHAVAIWNSLPWWPLFQDHKAPYRVYSFAHELGHVVWGLDPATAARAREFNKRRDEVAAGWKVEGKKQKKRPQKAKLKVTFEGLGLTWENDFVVEPIHAESEHYADDVGYQVYLSLQGKPATLPYMP
jgi:RHS repeat-associated protein